MSLRATARWKMRTIRMICGTSSSEPNHGDATLFFKPSDKSQAGAEDEQLLTSTVDRNPTHSALLHPAQD